MEDKITASRSATDELSARGLEKLAANYGNEIEVAKAAAVAMLKKLPPDLAPTVEPVHVFQPGR